MTTGLARTKRSLAIAIGLALPGLMAYARLQTPPSGRSPFRISVDVALVVLQSTMTDRQGKGEGKLSVRTRTGYIAGGNPQPGEQGGK
jgi:hypothetical protein